MRRQMGTIVPQQASTVPATELTQLLTKIVVLQQDPGALSQGFGTGQKENLGCGPWPLGNS